MEEWGNGGDLKVDLLATQPGRGRQGRDLGERTLYLPFGFDQRRARQRPLPRLTQQDRGLFYHPCLGAVTGDEFGMALGDFREMIFKGFSDTGIKSSAGSRSKVL